MFSDVTNSIGNLTSSMAADLGKSEVKKTAKIKLSGLALSGLGKLRSGISTLKGYQIHRAIPLVDKAEVAVTQKETEIKEQRSVTIIQRFFIRSFREKLCSVACLAKGSACISKQESCFRALPGACSKVPSLLEGCCKLPTLPSVSAGCCKLPTLPSVSAGCCKLPTLPSVSAGCCKLPTLPSVSAGCCKELSFPKVSCEFPSCPRLDNFCRSCFNKASPEQQDSVNPYIERAKNIIICKVVEKAVDIGQDVVDRVVIADIEEIEEDVKKPVINFVVSTAGRDPECLAAARDVLTIRVIDPLKNAVHDTTSCVRSSAQSIFSWCCSSS